MVADIIKDAIRDEYTSALPSNTFNPFPVDMPIRILKKTINRKKVMKLRMKSIIGVSLGINLLTNSSAKYAREIATNVDPNRVLKVTSFNTVRIKRIIINNLCELYLYIIKPIIAMRNIPRNPYRNGEINGTRSSTKIEKTNLFIIVL